MLGQRRRHLVTIQRKVEQVTVDGAPDGFAWVDVYTAIDADIVPLSGGEFVRADAEQKEIRSRCELPWLPDPLDESMRLLHLCCDQFAHNIIAVLPDPSYQRHQNLMLSAGLRYDPESTETFNLITEDGDTLVTENGDALAPEDAP